MQAREWSPIVAVAGGVAVSAAVWIVWTCFKNDRKPRRDSGDCKTFMGRGGIDHRAEKTRALEAYSDLSDKQLAEKSVILELITRHAEALAEQNEKSRQLLESHRRTGMIQQARSKSRAEDPPIARSLEDLTTLLNSYPPRSSSATADEIFDVIHQRKDHHLKVIQAAALVLGWTREVLEKHMHSNNQVRQVLARTGGA